MVIIENPLVSIIVPTYNAEKYIEKTLNSVFEQTYTNWEIILIDDVSTDNTRNIVEKYTYKKNVRFVQSTQKLYTPGARNKGIELSIGKYIAFLDADDFWHKNKLKKQIAFLESNNNIIISFTGVEKVNSEGKQLGELIIPKKITYVELLKGNKICCSSVIINQELLGNFKFNEEIKIVEDYALWLKILRESGSIASGINEPLTYYRVHNEAKTSNKLVSAFDTWKVLRKSENLSIIQSIIPFFFYAKDGLRKLLVR